MSHQMNSRTRGTCILLLAALFLSACHPITWTKATWHRVWGNEVRAVEIETLQEIADAEEEAKVLALKAEAEAKKAALLGTPYVAGVTPMVGVTPSSIVPFVPDSTSAAPVISDCMNWSDFVSMANGAAGVYELIDTLDARPEKIDHPVAEGAWYVNETSVFWTGLYVTDTTVGGHVSPIAVDGKTGTWLGTNGPFAVPSAGGEIKICSGSLTDARPKELKVNATRNGGTISTTTCVDTATVVKIINDNKKSDPNKIYRLLDEMVDNNTAARFRFGGQATVASQNAQTLVWVQAGQIVSEAVELDRTESKSLFLLTLTGDKLIPYPFSGMQLCTPMNPADEFGTKLGNKAWWGK